MFSKKSANSKTPPKTSAKIMKPDSNAMKKPVRIAPSIISADLVVTGNMVSGGEIQIDGTIEGDIRAASLTVGDQATVTGEIMAEEIIVRGRVIGTLRGLRIVLAASCHVEGDIMHESLSVEPGAFFEGNCRRSEDPLAKSADKPDQKKVKAVPARQKTDERSKSSLREADKDAAVVVKDGSVVVRRPAAI